MDIIIIGGGASGLTLASMLNNSKNVNVTIIEKNEHVGKKLLISGNGRCNLTNRNINKECFNNIETFNVVKDFNSEKYFNDLGLLTQSDEQGRIYPLSNTSNTVLDILRNAIKNVNVITNTEIIRVYKENNKYVLVSPNNTYKCDILVLATGGKTYYKECNSYNLASSLNLKVSELRPTLTYVKVKENLASLENIRVKAKAKLFANNQMVYEDEGEVLFKKDYLSGIVMFQLSSYIARNKYLNYKVELDLLPNFQENEIEKYLNKYNSLDGMFPKMVNQYVLRQGNNISYNIKHLSFNVIENLDFKNAQVTSGGVSFNELNENLESKVNKNLYLIGEIIDGDGMCGGYNLSFAFASANKVYEDIISKINE